MNNLHISLTNFSSASRVLKQIHSINSLDKFDEIHVAALHDSTVLHDELIDDFIHVKRFELSTRGWSKGLFVQSIKYIEFVVRVLFYYRKRKIKMVNIHKLSILPLGYLFKLFFGVILIYDTHELETEINGLSGVRKKISKWMERKLIYKCDHIFVVSENIADWYQKTYSIRRPTVVLNAPRIYSVKENDYFRERFNINKDQIIILYQGSLDSGRGIEIILKTFIARKEKNAVIVFMGYGTWEESIKEAASRSDLIFFHEAVPPAVLLNYTTSADIGISFIQNTCLSYYYCMPNKMFEYAMVGKPVIVSNMIEMRQFVEKHNMGFVVQNESVEDLNSLIDKLSRENLDTYKQNARSAAESNAWEKQEEKMLTDYKFILK